MISHPYPDGTLVKIKDYRKEHDSPPVFGIVESYVRGYEPKDSCYFVLVGEKLQTFDRNCVWPIGEI